LFKVLPRGCPRVRDKRSSIFGYQRRCPSRLVGARARLGAQNQTENHMNNYLVSYPRATGAEQARPHAHYVRAAAFAPCASHSGTFVAVCLQPTTTTPTPHCPTPQFLTPGRRGTTTAAAAAGGGGCPWAGSLLSSLPLSPSVGGGGMLSRRLCRRAVCRRQPFPPHSLGCRSVLCGQSGSAPSLHPRGARGGMCGEQPTCRLALGGTHGTAGSERALSVGAHFVCLHRRCSARGGTTA
jgi:hypothetical protein